MKKSGESVEESVLLIKVVSETTNSNLDWMGEVHAGREGGVILSPVGFPLITQKH